MANVIDELLVALGFEYDPSDLDDYNEGLTSTIDLVKTYAKVAAAATAATFGLVAASTAASDEQGKLSNQTGIAVGRIDALGFALQRVGGEASQMNRQLEDLSIRASEASRGMGTGAEAFGILGISVTDASGRLKTADNLLLEISDNLQRFSREEQIELADKVGLRDSILLLQEGSAGIRELTMEAEALGTTTAEDAALAADFQDSLVDIWRIVKQLSRVLTRSLAPVMQDIADAFTEWWKQNRRIIEQNIPRFIDGAARAMRLLTIAVGVLVAARLPALIASLVGLFRKLSLAMLVNVAILAGIVLLIEDVIGFLNGEDSVVGDLLQKYPQLAQNIDNLRAAWAGVKAIADKVLQGFREISNFLSSGTIAADFQLGLEKLGNDTLQFFKDLGNQISEFFTGLIDDTLGGAFKFITDLGDKFGFTDTSSTVAPDAGQSNVSSSNRISVGDINVSAAPGSDAAAIGEQVAASLSETLEPLLQQTSQDLNSAVVA